MHMSMDAVSDFELMERLQQGDFSAFDALIRRHQAALAGFFRQLGAYQEAEDLVQETFLRIFHARATYQPYAKFTTFLYTIARNVWADRWRKWSRWKKFREETEHEMRNATRAVAQDSAAMARLDAESALRMLPEKLRVVVILSVYQGLTYPEISEILGIPVGTVKTRMFHALARLKEYFDEDAS